MFWKGHIIRWSSRKVPITLINVCQMIDGGNATSSERTLGSHNKSVWCSHERERESNDEWKALDEVTERSKHCIIWECSCITAFTLLFGLRKGRYRAKLGYKNQASDYRSLLHPWKTVQQTTTWKSLPVNVISESGVQMVWPMDKMVEQNTACS